MKSNLARFEEHRAAIETMYEDAPKRAARTLLAVRRLADARSDAEAQSVIASAEETFGALAAVQRLREENARLRHLVAELTRNA